MRCEPQLLPFDIIGEDLFEFSAEDLELATASKELSMKANWGLGRREQAFT